MLDECNIQSSIASKSRGSKSSLVGNLTISLIGTQVPFLLVFDCLASSPLSPSSGSIVVHHRHLEMAESASSSWS